VLYAFLKPMVVAVLRALFRLRVVGTEHVPRSGPLLLAANHVSVFDPPVVGAAAARPLQYMAKAELFGVAGLGWLIRNLNAHPVQRDGADASALRHALSLLREGKALLVFPEGTRGVEGQLGPGRAGAGMLAAHSEAPVVPVYVRGTGAVLPKGARYPRRAPITVAFGPPLRFTSERGKRRYQAISDEIMAGIARLQSGVGVTPATVGLGPIRSAESEQTTRGPRPAGQIH
jgi:1-acyl-sn-glycerol-3-phosphate acyltransferase